MNDRITVELTDVRKIALLLLVCLLVITGCSSSDPSRHEHLNEVEVESLPLGVADIFDTQPEYGTLLLLDTPDNAVWLLFAEEETCLLTIERSPLSSRSEPVIELGPDDLLSSKGCNSPKHIRDKGSISTDESSQRSLVSAVLPTDYWTEEWSLDNTHELGPFEVIGTTPYSVHLLAEPSEIAKSRQTGELGQFLKILISCECGEFSMQTYVL